MEIHWGETSRPVHFLFKHLGHLKCCVFGRFCDCTGLSFGDLNDGGWFILRTPSEVIRFCAHLTEVLAKGAPRERKFEDVSLHVPGFSPEFQDTSVEEYDGTALDVPYFWAPSGILMVGSRRAGEAIHLEVPEVASAFEEALMQFGTAWATGDVDLRKEEPFTFALSYD